MGKDSWDDLSTSEKRSCTAHGAQAHRTGVTVAAYLEAHPGIGSGGGKKK